MSKNILMKFKKIFFLLALVLNFLILSAQQIIKEADYTLTYFPKSINIAFNSSAHVTAQDVFTKQTIAIIANGTNGFNIENYKPAQIIKMNYYLSTSKNVVNSFYIATPSASTGTMNVYFNHPVDVSYAQIQNAVNLSNTMDTKLITYINSCQSTLDIAIYSSYSASATTGIAGAINAAYTRGVQVRVIYDGTASNLISLLNTNIPRLPSPTTAAYTIMHNKFVIFDATNADATKPFVWTGSTNWTTSQIAGPDKNNVIVIQDQALAMGYKIEFEEMWGGSGPTPNLTNSKFGQYKTDNTPHHYIIGGKTVDSYFSPSDGTNAKIIAAINTANTDLEVAAMDITRTDCSTAIKNRYQAGVTNCNVLVDVQNPSGNQITTLQSTLLPNHAVVYSGSGIMHHKFMVVDNYNSTSDPLVLLGSHNWSTAAETKNDENTLIVHDLNIANQYYQAFAYLFQLAGGVITTPLGVVKDNFDGEILVYPNPFNGYFNLSTKSYTPIENVEISVYDMLGKSIFKSNYNDFSQTTIDLTSQATGIYLLQVTSNRKSSNFKLIKE